MTSRNSAFRAFNCKRCIEGEGAILNDKMSRNTVLLTLSCTYRVWGCDILYYNCSKNNITF